jgi:hypothetical protein
MTRWGRVLWAAVGATLITLATGSDGWAGSDTSRHETWNWNGTLPRGGTLEINGVNGSIVAEAGTGDRVVVTAEKSGRRHDPSLVRIEVQQDSDGIVICAVYPGESSPCRRVGLSFKERANDVEVDFHVSVPAGAQFTANNVNGGVHVRGLTGRVKARTVNGGCDIETSGSGQASTVNGAVHAAIGRLDSGDELSFRTVNGAITLRLPADVNAEVKGSTVNGSIQTDFPMTMSNGWGPRSASGRLGRGGAHLSAHTVNGSIRLERQTAQ